MSRSICNPAAAVVLLVLGAASCSTIPGTVLSPITGGVDLTRFHMDRGGSLLTAPFTFIGGAVSGPLVALWNGVQLDLGWACSMVARPKRKKDESDEDWKKRWSDDQDWHTEAYWDQYPLTFRPFEMIDR